MAMLAVVMGRGRCGFVGVVGVLLVMVMGVFVVGVLLVIGRFTFVRACDPLVRSFVSGLVFVVGVFGFGRHLFFGMFMLAVVRVLVSIAMLVILARFMSVLVSRHFVAWRGLHVRARGMIAVLVLAVFIVVRGFAGQFVIGRLGVLRDEVETFHVDEQARSFGVPVGLRMPTTLKGSCTWASGAAP